jgi:hypothetical protein
MSMTRREVLLGGLTAGSILTAGELAQAQGTTTVERLNEETLGNLLGAMGLRPTKTEKRYDFRFRSAYEGEEWNLTMSTVLSKDESSIWVMAWLDTLPKSAADVPRTALLRLLAENDRLGNGKFFAYIAANRRFVLQRVVDNQDMNTAKFAGILKDLGQSVALTEPFWTVENWKSASSEAQSQADDRPAPANPDTAARTGRTAN